MDRRTRLALTCTVALPLILGVGGGGPARAEDLWAVDGGLDDGSSTLLRLDPASGDTTTVGETGLEMQDVAVAPDGSLFAVNGTSLFALDATTGAATPIGDSGFSGLTGLAAQPGSGTLYAATADGQVLTLDASSGDGTLVGSVGAWDTIGDLAFSGSGKLYGTASRDDGTLTQVLLRVVPSTGIGTELGTRSTGFVDVLGLAFADDGRLWGAAIGNQDVAATIEIDPQAGDASFVAAVPGAHGLRGLASRPPSFAAGFESGSLVEWTDVVSR